MLRIDCASSVDGGFRNKEAMELFPPDKNYPSSEPRWLAFLSYQRSTPSKYCPSTASDNGELIPCPAKHPSLSL
jgi:hypothetical protein